jgi:serine phosphatase RsbU (regulator of sigma subunit)
VTIPPGGRLVLFTDGATEASDEDGRPFGEIGLSQSLRAAQRAAAQGLCQAAYDAVRAFCGDRPPTDDILLVAVVAD